MPQDVPLMPLANEYWGGGVRYKLVQKGVWCAQCNGCAVQKVGHCLELESGKYSGAGLTQPLSRSCLSLCTFCFMCMQYILHFGPLPGNKLLKGG